MYTNYQLFIISLNEFYEFDANAKLEKFWPFKMWRIRIYSKSGGQGLENPHRWAGVGSCVSKYF